MRGYEEDMHVRGYVTTPQSDEKKKRNEKNKRIIDYYLIGHMLSNGLCVLRNEIWARVERVYFTSENIRCETFKMPVKEVEGIEMVVPRRRRRRRVC